MQNGESIKGAVLAFKDEPWKIETVEKHAVFSGLTVSVDGQQCSKEPFCGEDATDYPALGCKIEVRLKTTLNKWHTHFRHGYYSNDVLVNFHGQVIPFRESSVAAK